MKILAIETSCDETAAAVVEDGTKVLSSVVASSRDMYEKYGGIVPEVAAREQLRCIIPTIDEAIKNASYDAIAVTVGPGLIGSLLVGVETAKTMAFVTGKPLIPVNHVLAHMYANFVESASPVIPGLTRNPSSSKTGSRLRGRDDKRNIDFPAISLVVSGGHTELYFMKNVKDLKWLGGTLDDAAGECFDKAARLLGFGSAGGIAIQEAAKKFTGHRSQVIPRLPRPMLDKKNEFNFSFSGLKTAILREVNTLKNNQQFNNSTIQQLSFEVQEAITDVLVEKTMRAAGKHAVKSILLSGGVSANLRLREKFMIHNSEFIIHVPPVNLCTDNAVYISSYAYFRSKPIDWHNITAVPDLSVEV